MSPTPPPAPEAALAAMLAALGPAPALLESVRAASAGGRVLATPVSAERDQPPFDRVMMDGIAVQAAALQSGHGKRAPVLKSTMSSLLSRPSGRPTARSTLPVSRPDSGS